MEVHHKAFQQSKEAFTKEILIKFSDFTKPFYLNTDASNVAISGELYQIDNENRHATLGFVSRTLKNGEMHYTTIEIDALVYSCAKFREYILGHQTIIFTDHQAFLKQNKLLGGRSM